MGYFSNLAADLAGASTTMGQYREDRRLDAQDGIPERAPSRLTLPTPSQMVSAQLHLSRRDQWIYSRTNGVRYISMPNSTGTRVYRVRADGRGCECRWYTLYQTICSHGLAAREAAHHDTLAAWVSSNDERIADEADALLNEYEDRHDLEVESALASVSATAHARQEARRKFSRGYAELFKDED